ncbi:MULTISPECIES: hypothetical protein [Bradyrhizobium]|uniref:hypothetical protein n=1 Tax=Bradyrhizobium TaxID=374 RepID=UPI001E3A6A56
MSIVRDGTFSRKSLLALLVLAPGLAGCSSASDMFSRDAEWFSRPGRLFIRNISIESPPLTPDKPVTSEDLVSADGGCPGMAPPAGAAGANALADGAPPPQPSGGSVALGHTECDVVRGIGAPDSVNLSNGPGGDRVAVVTWSRGARAGIYTFTAGRLTSVERGPDPVPEPKAAKPKKKKSATSHG